MGLKWGFRRIGGRFFRIKRQERIPLRAGPPGAPDFHREAGDEDAGEAGRNQNGKGENVHGKGRGGNQGRSRPSERILS